MDPLRAAIHDAVQEAVAAALEQVRPGSVRIPRPASFQELEAEGFLTVGQLRALRKRDPGFQRCLREIGGRLYVDRDDLAEWWESRRPRPDHLRPVDVSDAAPVDWSVARRRSSGFGQRAGARD